MKSILILVFALSLYGCVFVGKNLIHSPESSGGYEHRTRHIHGGVTKNSPPDMITLESSNIDSTFITIGAKHLHEKKILTGIVLPIIPVFFLPKVDYYRNDPLTLTVFLLLSSNKEATFFTDSIELVINEKTYLPQNISYQDKKYRKLKIQSDVSNTYITKQIPIVMNPEVIQLDFPISAKQSDQFQLIINGIYFEDRKVSFSTVNFKKTKQKFWFMGP